MDSPRKLPTAYIPLLLMVVTPAVTIIILLWLLSVIVTAISMTVVDGLLSPESFLMLVGTTSFFVVMGIDLYARKIPMDSV